MKTILLLSALVAVTLPQSDTDAYSNLSWFIHITDTHVSHIEEPSRISDLRDFVTSSLAVLKPEVVLCSGDLTNAKRPGHLTASQSEEEWRTYKEVVDSRWNNVTWLDIRGNHDNLNVLSRNSSSNMFAEFSVQGRKGNLRSYVHQHNGTQKINFVAIDATWEVGMTFPFNFEGYLDEQEQERLGELKKKLRNPGSLNIMFGHYPTSVIYQSSLVRDLLKSTGLVYMAGHLHDLMMFKAHHLYTFHEDRSALELELADWKHNRAYRLFAVDHGIFTFADIKHGEWPVVLTTFPKDSRFWLHSEVEALQKLKERRQIRVLAFSDVPVLNVTITIQTIEFVGTKVGSGPLYTAAWPEALDLSHGLYSLKITVVDMKERSKTIHQTFTFDEEDVESFDWTFANLVLRCSFASIFHAMFVLTLLANLLTMLLLRLKSCSCFFNISCSTNATGCLKCFEGRNAACYLVKRLLIVCHHNRLYYPILGFLIYMTVGPWVIGSLVEGRNGAVFAWGVVMFEGGKLPTQTTFVWYFIHFGLIHPVMVVFIGQVAEWRLSKVTILPPPSVLSNILALVFFLVYLAASIFFSLTFWMHFGALGFFFGPLKTWSYVFYGAMIWLAATLPEDSCIEYMRLTNNGYQKKVDVDTNLAERGSLKSA